MPTTFQKLLAKGRLSAIVREDHEGNLAIFEYRRKNQGKGKRSGQVFTLKTPQVIARAGAWEKKEGKTVVTVPVYGSEPPPSLAPEQIPQQDEMGVMAQKIKEWGEI